MNTALLRRRTFGLVLTLAVSLGAPARAEQSLEGDWETPLGVVELEQSGGRFTGKLADSTRLCPFPKGSEVLRGRVGDGIFVGEMRVCFPSRCRTRDEWVLVMAAPAADGERLAGVVANGDCADLAFKGRPFVLGRHRRAQPAAQLAPPSDGATRQRRMKPEAQRLFREGMEQSSFGRYELARGKFEAAARLEPRNADILTQIGITHYARANYREAERYYRKAVQADGSHTVAYYNLACVLAKQNKVREALRELRRAVDTGFASTATMDADHDLDPLRGAAAFQDIRADAERNAARAGR